MKNLFKITLLSMSLFTMVACSSNSSTQNNEANDTVAVDAAIDAAAAEAASTLPDETPTDSAARMEVDSIVNAN